MEDVRSAKRKSNSDLADPETLPILKTCAQSDEKKEVRESAVHALVRGWRDDPEMVRILMACWDRVGRRLSVASVRCRSGDGAPGFP